MLGRAGWTERAPLLAIVVYLAAGWSVIAAVGLAGLTLAVHATVPGGQPTVIVTTGAVRALDPGQLDAVLAHERAHLAGRHHQLAALARIGREVLPFVPLMRDADQQVARLVELHADDAAARARDPRLLATALVVLATAASPAPALAAAATDSVQRIQDRKSTRLNSSHQIIS